MGRGAGVLAHARRCVCKGLVDGGRGITTAGHGASTLAEGTCCGTAGRLAPGLHPQHPCVQRSPLPSVPMGWRRWGAIPALLPWGAPHLPHGKKRAPREEGAVLHRPRPCPRVHSWAMSSWLHAGLAVARRRGTWAAAVTSGHGARAHPAPSMGPAPAEAVPHPPGTAAEGPQPLSPLRGAGFSWQRKKGGFVAAVPGAAPAGPSVHCASGAWHPAGCPQNREQQQGLLQGTRGQLCSRGLCLGGQGCPRLCH